MAVLVTRCCNLSAVALATRGGLVEEDTREVINEPCDSVSARIAFMRKRAQLEAAADVDATADTKGVRASSRTSGASAPKSDSTSPGPTKPRSMETVTPSRLKPSAEASAIAGEAPNEEKYATRGHSAILLKRAEPNVQAPPLTQ